MPIEWDSWLRGRRAVPPTQAELDVTAKRVARNQTVMQPNSTQTDNGSKSESQNNPFPKYDDMDMKPGGPIRRN